jgi:hypothetical protein
MSSIIFLTFLLCNNISFLCVAYSLVACNLCMHQLTINGHVIYAYHFRTIVHFTINIVFNDCSAVHLPFIALQGRVVRSCGAAVTTLFHSNYLFIIINNIWTVYTWLIGLFNLDPMPFVFIWPVKCQKWYINYILLQYMSTLCCNVCLVFVTCM